MSSSAPLFFVSYARSDDDSMIRTFFADLSDEVRVHSGRGRDAGVGFLSGAYAGATEWTPQLVQAVSTAQAFIALCSPNYFRSEWCGREWAAFAARRATADRIHGDPAGALLPLIWTRTELPAGLGVAEFRHPSINSAYGLRRLMSLSARDDDYRKLVAAVAARIVEAAGRIALPPLRGVTDLRTLPSAFVPKAPPLVSRIPRIHGLSGLSLLGRSKHATVFRATQESTGREVAIKVENGILHDKSDQRGFLRDARIAGRMSSHPYVVDLLDMGITVDEYPYLVMELCDGSFADPGALPLSAARARDIGVKIADALAYAHQQGVVHGGVKPANILRSRSGEPVLAEFMPAAFTELGKSFLASHVADPTYAAPETVARGRLTPAADVYGLCATLYALLRGMPHRWRDDRAPLLATVTDFLSEPIRDLPGLPADLMRVLRTGMADEPGARPSAQLLRDTLAALPLDSSVNPPGLVMPSTGDAVSLELFRTAQTRVAQGGVLDPTARKRRWWTRIVDRLAGIPSQAAGRPATGVPAIGAPPPDSGALPADWDGATLDVDHVLNMLGPPPENTAADAGPSPIPNQPVGAS